MSVIARRVAASPARTATQAWAVVTDVLFSEWASPPRLDAAVGAASSSIADGLPRTAPFVLTGAGPRVRVYCLYGDDAIEGDDANESPIDLDGTDADWTLWLPCDADDLDWVTESLASLQRVTPYDAAVGLPDEAASAQATRAEFQINTDLLNQL